METINETLGKVRPGITPESRQSSDSRSLTREQVLDLTEALADVWDYLVNTYGAKFSNQFGRAGEEGFQHWAKDLAEERILDKQLYAAIANIKRDRPQFAPDLNELIRYCRDMSCYGLPEIRTAYLEGIAHLYDWKTHEWSHPAVLQALRDSNITAMKGMSEKNSSKVFYRNYEIRCRQVVAGTFTAAEIPQALEKQEAPPVGREQHQRRMAQLRETLNLKPDNVRYLVDKNRHLVCVPYSLKGLHQMAEKLGIKRCWFHKNHYDVPARRMDEIMAKCELVSSKDIVRAIRCKL